MTRFNWLRRLRLALGNAAIRHIPDQAARLTLFEDIDSRLQALPP